MKKITKKERRRVLAYISEVAPLLGIADCEIVLSKETTDGDEADADVAHVPDTRRQYLRLSPHWMSFSNKHKTLVLLHEMMHMALSPLMQAVNVDKMSEGHRLYVNSTEEVVVDSIALALRPVIPQYPGKQGRISSHVHIGTKTGI